MPEQDTSGPPRNKCFTHGGHPSVMFYRENRKARVKRSIKWRSVRKASSINL